MSRRGAYDLRVPRRRPSSTPALDRPVAGLVVGTALVAALVTTLFARPAALTPAHARPLAASAAASSVRPVAAATGAGHLADPDARRSVTTPAAPAPVAPAPAAPAGVPVSTLAADDIPVVALDAYHHGADLAATSTPGCHLDWPLLAAIGRVESDHGQFQGSRLYADGSDFPHIIGIALDGTASAAVPDTDGGRLDGDPVWDHAVGPMQVIPGTWARHGLDANGDGTADPFNIIDAAATAGAYLCAGGRDVATPAGRTAAVTAYNSKPEYIATVLALADVYAGKPPPVSTTPPPAAPPTTTPGAPPTRPATPTGTPTTGGATPPPTSPSPTPTCSTPTGGPTDTPTQSPTGTPTGTPTDGACPTPTPTGTAADPAPTP